MCHRDRTNLTEQVLFLFDWLGTSRLKMRRIVPLAMKTGASFQHKLDRLEQMLRANVHPTLTHVLVDRSRHDTSATL